MQYSTKREKTEGKIIAAYMELIKEKELSQITVKDVCRLTDINRSTFYTYFHDVYEMAEFVERDLVEKISGRFLSDIDRIKSLELEEMMSLMMDTLYENDNLPLVLIRRGSGDFEERFVNIIMKNLVRLKGPIGDEVMGEVKMLMKYHLSGVAAMIDELGDVEDDAAVQRLIVNAIKAARQGPITAILSYLY